MTLKQQKQVYRQSICTLCMLLVSLLLAGLYVYLLSRTVVHVVMQKEINKELQEVGSQIADLEAVYIEQQHSMSNEVATLQGFVTITDKIFIDKTQSSLVLRTGE